MFIDCPPSLTLLTVNGLVAAQSVLIPMQCEYYALEGLTDLVGTMKQVQANLNPQLEITGLVRTMYDPRNTLAQQVSAQLETHFGDKVYHTVMPRNVRLAEAPSYGMPAVVWDPESKGAQAYLALAEEMLERERLACRRPLHEPETQRTRARPRRAAGRRRGARGTHLPRYRWRAFAPGTTSRARAWIRKRWPSSRPRSSRRD